MVKESQILIVDDDPSTRLLLRGILVKDGYRVAEAGDGPAALSEFARVQPHLVLLDAMMPGMDGFEVCRQLRQRERGADIPILMLTSLDDVDSIEQAFHQGATDFLTKPINWSLLRQRIRSALHARVVDLELRSSQLQLQRAQEVALLGNWDWDLKQDEMRCSAGICQIFGIEHHSVRPCLDRLMEQVLPQDRELFSRALDVAVERCQSFHIEFRIIRSDDAVRHVSLQGDVLAGKGEQAERLVGIFQDVTEQREAEARLDYQTWHDSLTGLPNRQWLERRLEDSYRRGQRSGGPVTVLFVAMDRFKRLNDSLGYDAGDRLLQEVAERLCRVSPEEDTVFRFSGDEFVVLLEDACQHEKIFQLAQNILMELSRPHRLAGQEVTFSASIGVVAGTEGGGDAATLLRNAGTAMYRAKMKGGGGISFFQEGLDQQARDRFELENALRSALEGEELLLYFQPKFNTGSRGLSGAEALLRWRHPQRGMVSPAEFIPLAEESGLILPLGRWVFRCVCEQISRWLDEGRDCPRIAVNLSPRQLGDPQLLASLESVLEDTGVDPGLLELEITESCVMTDPEQHIIVLRRLRELGLTLAIDDFGTGHSSLSYLQRLPVDCLKIDQSFIREMSPRSRDGALVKAIIALASALELWVVAEGVETGAQVEMLSELGCHELQGFHCGRPVPAEDFAGKYLSERRAGDPESGR